MALHRAESEKGTQTTQGGFPRRSSAPAAFALPAVARLTQKGRIRVRSESELCKSGVAVTVGGLAAGARFVLNGRYAGAVDDAAISGEDEETKI